MLQLSETTFQAPAELASRARGVLCAAPCRELGLHNVTLAKRLRLFRGRVTGEDENTMTTWLPQMRADVALQVLPDGKTVVFLEGEVYYGSPAVSLQPTCPGNLVFMAQYTEDNEEGGTKSPRLLVYDVWHTEEPNMHPAERYRLLRERYAGFLCAPLCTVQWVGYLTAARQVMRDRHAYAHEIGGLMCLHPDCHCVVIPLELHVLTE